VKVFLYVIVVDSGSAPSFEPPLATLALCKPKIRHHAQYRDLVIGFTGRKLGPEPHAVRWAGVVSERLTFAEYWRDVRFARKKPREAIASDNIYRPRGSTYAQVDNPKHGAEAAKKDLSGRFVLVFDPSWYFGPTAPVLAEKFGFRIIGGRRGHRVWPISSGQWRELRAWFDAHLPAEVSSGREALTTKRTARTLGRLC
jgi:Nucleotide modification associated domain 2